MHIEHSHQIDMHVAAMTTIPGQAERIPAFCIQCEIGRMEHCAVRYFIKGTTFPTPASEKDVFLSLIKVLSAVHYCLLLPVFLFYVILSRITARHRFTNSVGQLMHKNVL